MGQPPTGQPPMGQAPGGQPPGGQPPTGQPPQPYPVPPPSRPSRKPLILSGLAGAVAGAVLAAGIAVPVTMAAADEDAPSGPMTGEGTMPGSGPGSDSGSGPGSGFGFGSPGGGSGFGFGGDAQGSGNSPSGAQASDEQSEGVVLVESVMQGGSGAGTGMVLESDGLVLTNYHVVEDSTQVRVTVADDGTTYDADVVGADEEADVAVLQLEDASGLDTVALDDDGDAVVGASVTAVGNAQGQGYLSAMPGSVTALDQDISTSHGLEFGASGAELTGLVQTDAAVVSGYSGGPMLDEEGEVVAVTTAASTDAAQSFAVPIEDALAIVEQIEDGDQSGSVRIGPGAFLGIGAQSAVGGVTIAEVEKGGPAAEAGLVAGDTITALGQTRVGSLSDLTRALARYQPGDEVQLSWTTAAGASRSATVTLGESPVN